MGFNSCRRPQPLEEKPKTQDYIKETYGRIEPPQADDLVEVGIDEECEGAHRGKR